MSDSITSLDELPLGLRWIRFWVDQDWQALGDEFFVAGVVIAAAFNALLLTIGHVKERRHDRRLATIDAATASVQILVGKPPAGLRGVPHLVQVSLVMAPAPLGRLSVLLRRLIGGRILVRQRDVQRARHEALLRLRERALALGSPVLAGVDVGQIGFLGDRIGVIATGTAFVPHEAAKASAPPTAPPILVPRLTEAAASVPPRHWRELAIALLLLALVSGVAIRYGDVLDRLYGVAWGYATGRMDKHIHKKARLPERGEVAPAPAQAPADRPPTTPKQP